MIYLAQLIRYPQIHRDMLALAQKGRQCTKTDKKILRRPMLDQKSMWNLSDSERILDIQYNTPKNSDEDSETIPLARQLQGIQEKGKSRGNTSRGKNSAIQYNTHHWKTKQDPQPYSTTKQNPLQQHPSKQDSKENNNQEQAITIRSEVRGSSARTNEINVSQERQQQNRQRRQSLVHMDLSNIQNSKTNEVINLASDSSTASPVRIVASSSPRDFMTELPPPKKHMDNILDNRKANNKELGEQNPQNTQSDSETDYANIITIKKTDTQPPKPIDNNTTQQNSIVLQPQQASPPIQPDDTPQQTLEHDSTSDIENEPEPETNAATKDENQHQLSTHASADIVTRAPEQSSIS